MKRDTFNRSRMKSGGHNRWVERGCPTIPTHMPSGVLAYQAGQTLKDIKAASARALDKFKPAAVPGFFESVKLAALRFMRRRP